MKQTKFNSKTLLFMLFLLCCLAGCKTSRKAETSKLPESARYLSSKVKLARMEVTPEEILLVDRMGKRYVRATRKELKDVLPKKADFAHLEKILFDASKPDGKKDLSGKELGIPSLEKGKVELSNFSNDSFSLTPTELSSKYTQVELNEILEMLMSL